ncbi:hypothetical protein P3S67_014109 [Capsicum chacoense]
MRPHFLNQDAKTLKRRVTKIAPILESSADEASPATTTSNQSGDLSLHVKSNRKAPSVLLQYKIGKQRLREARIVGLFPLLTKIAALMSFSLDKLHYWRESASGMSSLAYFLVKDTIDHINTIWAVLLPVVLTLVASKNSAFTAIVGDYINSKWALEAFIIANAKRTTTTIALPSIIPQAGLWKH